MSYTVRGNEAKDLTILSGAQVTQTVTVKGYASGSFGLPAALTGTALSIEVSVDGTTFKALKNAAGTAVTVPTVAAGDQLPIPADAFSFPYLRLKSGTAEAADRTVKIFLKA